jgi:predicted TIM-barrel fold metal-dependent hydrolase
MTKGGEYPPAPFVIAIHASYTGPPMATLARALIPPLLVCSLFCTLDAQAPRGVPVGDYHAHIMSEAAGRMLAQRPLPSITLPADLDAVVRDFTRFTQAGDARSLARLFTKDALFPDQTGSLQGPRDRRIRPLAFTLRDSVATITGSLADSGSRGLADVATVTLTLRREANAKWLIASLRRETIRTDIRAPVTADQLVTKLDSAGIKRAVVLSVAYWFGSALMPGSDSNVTLAEEHARVRTENDWVASQVARHPDRLVAFCSVNPLKPYALEEIERCGRHPGIRGLKLHLANSSVDLRKPADVEQLRRVFRAANSAALPMVVHMRPRLQPYGREDAEVFLREVLPNAPDIPIQIAHLVGWGGYDEAADTAASAFVDAIARNDPVTTHLYFDIATIVLNSQSAETRERIATRIRQLGVNRVVYGSDGTDPRTDWAGILRLIPLSEREFETIAGNVTPYLGPR